jgi:hypothetical protein
MRSVRDNMHSIHSMLGTASANMKYSPFAPDSWRPPFTWQPFNLVEVGGVQSLELNRLWAPFRNEIKLTSIMGAYKGRVNLRQRRRRFVKGQRIKALAATKKRPASPLGAAQQSTT